ncbi:hypothetical protein HPB47_015008 [Ixodes persulcatus]|uniref:Uncharacterized protein n=1 Tax=Ixodes persulcatus TaxID=34615 RepID=A0AC60QVH6_IXOPE|nr:hypothetical protein HPB47_015008 [Ixodes persulcatus]
MMLSEQKLACRAYDRELCLLHEDLPQCAVTWEVTMHLTMASTTWISAPLTASSVTQVEKATGADSGTISEKKEDRACSSTVATPEDSGRDTSAPSKTDVCIDVVAETEDDESAMNLNPAVVKRRRDGETKDSAREVLHGPERKWQVVGKKGRHTANLRSASLTRNKETVSTKSFAVPRTPGGAAGEHQEGEDGQH